MKDEKTVLQYLEEHHERRPDDSAIVQHVLDKAKQYSEAAIDTLHEVCLHGKSDRDRVMAANSVLDRAMGKPVAHITAQTTTGSYKDLLHLIQAKEDILLEAKNERDLTVHDVLNIKVIEPANSGDKENIDVTSQENQASSISDAAGADGSSANRLTGRAELRTERNTEPVNSWSDSL